MAQTKNNTFTLPTESPKNERISCDELQDVLPTLKHLLPEFKNLSDEDFKVKEMTGGSTNKLYRVGIKPKKEYILVRIFGKGTENLIDREAELRIMKSLEPTGLGPKVYATFSNGYLYEFFEGKTLTPEDLRKQTYNSKIAQHIAQWHKATPESVTKDPVLWINIKKWMSQVPKKFKNEQHQKAFDSWNLNLEKEAEILKDILQVCNSPVVLCHNDIQSGNIVINDNYEVKLIDMEYSSFNYRGFDLANHFCEYSGLQLDYQHFPSTSVQREFLLQYLKEFLGRDPVQSEIEQILDEVNRYVLASHFMWGIWALVQAENSDIDFDYIEYGRKRFEFYRSHKLLIK